jgi:MinD-like ATPase involved in chromosome partitioning or flagellar assembly
VARGDARAAEGPAGKRAFTIGVLAARGGLGVSSTAINLGGAIYDATGSEVIVAELRPGMGTIGPDLGLSEPLGLTRLLQTQQADITRQKVKDELFHHDSGVRVLPASINPRDSILLNNEAQMEMVVGRLAFLASYLILDLGPGLPPLTQKLIKSCNELIVIVEPVPNSVQHARAMIASRTGYDHTCARIALPGCPHQSHRSPGTTCQPDRSAVYQTR